MKKILIILFAGLFSFTISAQVYKGASTKSVEEKLNEEYCTGLFKSTDGTILDVASSNSASSYINIIDWLQGRVSGLQVYTSRMGGLSVPVLRGGVPGIFLDEMQITLSHLNMINVNDIAIIKVIKTPFFGGFNSGHGAIAIYTLGGEEEEEEASDSNKKSRD